jgi:hypothetical protein
MPGLITRAMSCCGHPSTGQQAGFDSRWLHAETVAGRDAEAVPLGPRWISELEEMEMHTHSRGPGTPTRRGPKHAEDDAAGASLISTRPDLTAEEASRMAVNAVTSDLEYWASSASVDGRVDLNELTRVFDVIRQSSVVS